MPIGRLVSEGIVYCLQEDDHLTLLDLGNKQTSLFAVFDGHGGQLVAKFTAKYMPKIFMSSEYFKSEDFGLAVADTFYKIDELLETEEGKKELKKMGHVSSKAKSDSSKGYEFFYRFFTIHKLAT